MTIEDILDRVTHVTGVRAALFCSYDGISIASQTRVGTLEAEQLAAMSAEIGRAAAKLLRTRDNDRLVIGMFNSSTGKLVMADVAKGFLVAVTDQGTNIGILRMEVERAGRDLATSLEEHSIAGARPDEQT